MRKKTETAFIHCMHWGFNNEKYAGVLKRQQLYPLVKRKRKKKELNQHQGLYYILKLNEGSRLMM